MLTGQLLFFCRECGQFCENLSRFCEIFYEKNAVIQLLSTGAIKDLYLTLNHDASVILLLMIVIVSVTPMSGCTTGRCLKNLERDEVIM